VAERSGDCQIGLPETTMEPIEGCRPGIAIQSTVAVIAIPGAFNWTERESKNPSRRMIMAAAIEIDHIMCY
jgi:hypothetical protein